MKKAIDISFVIIIALFLFGVGIGIFVLPDKIFSERENRPLATLPTASVRSLLDGSFSQKLSDFYSDQLPFRDEFGSLYAISELALGKNECNRVLLRDETLITRPEESGEIYSYNLGAINSFLESHPRSVFFCPPESIEVFSSLLSGVELGLLDALPPPQNEISEEYLRVVGRLGADRLYYRTDHHWTTDGAFEAYKLLCDLLGAEAYGEEHFEKITVSESFFGSSYRRSSFPKSLICADSIVLYRYSGDERFSVGEQSGFYRYDQLGSSDEYRVFLGGNCAHASVTLNGANERRKMLLIKDSFANSLLPFLALHYDIEMVDPRYASPTLVKELLESEEFDAILVLCSKGTLLTDRSFGNILLK